MCEVRRGSAPEALTDLSTDLDQPGEHTYNNTVVMKIDLSDKMFKML